MKSRPTFLGAFLSLLVVVALSHLVIHMAFYGHEVFAKRGLTGMAIESSKAEGLPISEVILFLEWGLIFLGVLFVYAKHKVDLKKEYVYLDLLKQKKHFSGGTEIDKFFELLQEMKHFRLATAAKVFDVDIDLVEDWARSLESSKVAELTYPRIGGPEIWLVEGKNLRNEESDESEDEISKEVKK